MPIILWLIGLVWTQAPQPNPVRPDLTRAGRTHRTADAAPDEYG